LIQAIASLSGSGTLTPQPRNMTNDWRITALFVVAHVLVGLSSTAVASVLIFNRAAATRAMFDNRTIFGASIILCGCSNLSAAIGFYWTVIWIEAALLAAMGVVSVALAWLTLRSIRFERAPPA
jgi:hypothetical protein